MANSPQPVPDFSNLTQDRTILKLDPGGLPSPARGDTTKMPVESDWSTGGGGPGGFYLYKENRLRAIREGVSTSESATSPPESEEQRAPISPDFGGVLVDRSDPESMGEEPVFSGLLGPSFYKGSIDAATFLFDLPIKATGWALGEGAEALGWDELAKGLRDPVTLGDIAKQVFEAPATIERAITGEDPGWLTRGFDVTPRTAQNAQERFWRDLFYIGGGALSFPTSLGALFGTFRKPVQKLLDDAAGRGTNSEAARKILEKAYAQHLTASEALKGAKGPSSGRALVEAARQYANQFTFGLGTKPLGTMGRETAFAFAAGAGYGAPELLPYADDKGRIMMDLGDVIGNVDVMPSLKVLASMGLPIALAHAPSGIALAGDKTGAKNVLRWVLDKGRSFGTSLLGGVTEKGRKDLATRIFMAMQSDPAFLETVLLPAVENGAFMNEISGPFTPIKILDDGTVIATERYSFGGIVPDTLQLARQLGVDDPKMALLDDILSGRAGNAYARLGEEARRAERLEETFDLLKTSIAGGDESATFRALEKIQANLEKESMAGLENAVLKAGEVYELLEPAIGGAEASRLAVLQLHEAKVVHQTIRRHLWDKDVVGADYVDTRTFGDWAALQIADAQTARTTSIRPGMGIFYKIAGQRRLKELGIGKSGEPLTTKDLEGVKGSGDTPLQADEIGPNGLFDIHGHPGTVTSLPVKIHDLDKFRSEMGDASARAYNQGDSKTGHNYGLVIKYIDNDLLTGENLSKRWLDELDQSHLPPDEMAAWREYVAAAPSVANLRNIKIARTYSEDGFRRFGPDSPIGKILYRGDKPVPEEFLQTLLRSGSGSGKRVDMFRDALNEPQRVLEGYKVRWVRDPAGGLSLGDNPNVIEAELLRRFTTSFYGDSATQRNIDRFLTKYGDAVDQVPGLRSKFNDLEGLQKSVDAMAAKLTTPNKQTVIKALRNGATPDDILNARRILRDTLGDEQLSRTASEYLGADVNKAASEFITSDLKNIDRRAEQLSALLAKDETGRAAEGFRSALFRVLRESSKRVDPETGKTIPGVNTRKLVETIEEIRPYLEKFYGPDSMALLETDLVRGGMLQGTGARIPAQGRPEDILSVGQDYAAKEAAAGIGRAAGQKAFGSVGINTLAAANMGRRLGTRLAMKLGEEGILKLVEAALRSPEKAAELIKHFRTLPEYKVPKAVEKFADSAVSDPSGTAKAAATDAKDRLKGAVNFVQKYLKGYSKEAIERAVRFGLIPAQAEYRERRMTPEEDWEKGFPFQYQENKNRYEIENPSSGMGPGPGYKEGTSPAQRMQKTIRGIGPRSSAAPAAPPPIAQASALARANPLGPPSPGTMERGRELFGPNDPVFRVFSHGGYIEGPGSGGGRLQRPGGIMSVRRKARQLVG